MFLSFRKCLSRSVAAALLALCAAMSAFGVTIDEYVAQLVEIDELVGKLHVYLDNLDQNEDEDPAFEKKTIQAINQKTDRSQIVVFDGHEIKADNSWILIELAQYVDQKEDFEAQRIRLVSIRERILAIRNRIDDLRAAKSGGLSKDEQKQKLAEILNHVDYAKPTEEKESWLMKLLKRIDEWLAKSLPAPNVPSSVPEGVKGISVVLQIVLYALIAALIAFLLYKFVPILVTRFRKRERRDKGSRTILGEILESDETSETLFDEAEKLARSGDLRGAIRKGYIAFLCELSDRRLVGLAQHKTNRDYLRDVRREPRIHQGLSGLTERFERHWYGVENADETVWSEFRETYRTSLEQRS